VTLKGVLIDFGDTLAYVDRKSDVKYREGLLSIMIRRERSVDLNSLALALDPVYGKSSRGEVKDFDEFWRLVLKNLTIAPDPELIKELDDFRSHNYASVFSLYPRAVPVLQYLKKKYTLALVSNCSIGTRLIISSLGIDIFFKAIVLSYEVGARKPDKRMYVRALESTDLTSKDCIFIADEISDLEGARDVGLGTLLVRQGSLTNHEVKDPSFAPDFQCASISEITKIL